MARGPTPRKMATRNRRRREIAAGMIAGTLPPFIGIRIKPMSRELHARSLRTLDLFVTTLVKAGKRLPDNFAITVPKVMTPAHVDAVDRACAALERQLKLKRNSLRLELMIETPQSILAPDGSVGAARAGGRRRRPRARRAFRRLRLHRARAASPRRGSTRATSPATSRGT